MPAKEIESINVNYEQIPQLTRFTKSQVLWIIFGNCWCREAYDRVESTCKAFSLPYVELSKAENQDRTVKLTTKAAGYTFENRFAHDSKNLTGPSHRCPSSDFRHCSNILGLYDN